MCDVCAWAIAATVGPSVKSNCVEARALAPPPRLSIAHLVSTRQSQHLSGLVVGQYDYDGRPSSSQSLSCLSESSGRAQPFQELFPRSLNTRLSYPSLSHGLKIGARSRIAYTYVIHIGFRINARDHPHQGILLTSSLSPSWVSSFHASIPSSPKRGRRQGFQFFLENDENSMRNLQGSMITSFQNHHF